MLKERKREKYSDDALGYREWGLNKKKKKEGVEGR